MVNQPYPPDPRTPGEVPSPEWANDDTIKSVNTGGSYMESQHANYVNPTGNQVENQVEVYEDKNLQRANMRYWITTVIYFLAGVLEVILGLRFIFRLLGASQSNDFIMSLYNLSHVFVSPFNGIFNDQALGTRSVFEISTLVAMLIYALIAWGLAALGRVVFAPNFDSRQRVVTTRHRQY